VNEHSWDDYSKLVVVKRDGSVWLDKNLAPAQPGGLITEAFNGIQIAGPGTMV